MAASGRVPQLHGLMVLDVVEGMRHCAPKRQELALMLTHWCSLICCCTFQQLERSGFPVRKARGFPEFQE